MRGYFARENQEIREKPCTYELEWGNPGTKNLPVHRRAFSFDASKEHENRTQVWGESKKVQCRTFDS
jgi:hypothetical protein